MNIRVANDTDIEEISNLYIMNWKKTYENLLPVEFLNSLNLSDEIKKWKSYLSKKFI